MKKLLLVVALLFATSMLFAQVPECEDCVIDQLSSADRLNATIQDSDIDQVGTDNLADVDQFGQLNYAKIHQWGDPDDDGMNNVAGIFQTGYQNRGTIKQYGDRNTNTITQHGKYNYAVQTVGDIIGFHWAEGYDNTATVDQSGDMNTSFQFQRNDHNTASVTQINQYPTGTNKWNGNYAEQRQDSEKYGADGSDATIYQKGQENAALQNQLGSNNTANAYQEGFMNKSIEIQISTLGFENTSTVYQFGPRNSSNVMQNTEGIGDNLSDVNQVGRGNNACVNQTGGASPH
ncbi:hypothetical protein [Lutibacter citreus]|uniref:hypothetical protein n=1 Tax=Lutibacter citreus TaxID=2138210 RepID=UPI000DBE389F|nr:hypothetical protein [Lutibacter citreus]